MTDHEDELQKARDAGMNVVEISPQLARMMEGNPVDDIEAPDVIGVVRLAGSFVPKAANMEPEHMVQDVPGMQVARIAHKLQPGTVVLQIAGRAGRPAQRMDLTPAELALFVGLGQRLLSRVAK